MKIQTALLAIFALLLGAAIARAETPEADTDAQFQTFTYPQVIHAAQPRVFAHEVGKTVHLQLRVDARGQPYAVAPAPNSKNDPRLERRVIDAVSQWIFAPARNAEGKALPMAVRLPVHITDMERG